MQTNSPSLHTPGQLHRLSIYEAELAQETSSRLLTTNQLAEWLEAIAASLRRSDDLSVRIEITDFDSLTSRRVETVK